MGIQAIAAAISARDAQKIQAEVSIRVFRLALDAQASAELALLNSANLASGVAQNLNVIA